MADFITEDVTMRVARSRRLIATWVTVIVGVVTLATFVRGQERQG